MTLPDSYTRELQAQYSEIQAITIRLLEVLLAGEVETIDGIAALAQALGMSIGLVERKTGRPFPMTGVLLMIESGAADGRRQPPATSRQEY